MKKFNEIMVGFNNSIAAEMYRVDEMAALSAIDLINSVIRREGKIILAGNGGSASIAAHVAVDFIKAAGIRAVTFNEANLITCFANDYGYENWLEKCIKFYADRKDLVILISSSGKSPNMLNAAQTCRSLAIPIITFSGFSEENLLRKLGDVNFWVNSHSYNVVEMVHHIWLLGLVEYFISLRK
jgi:D-sedoheptulose 7-phosphate isomerase